MWRRKIKIMRLLINQKNEIFDAIESFKFSALQFSYIFNGVNTDITHLNSKFYFKIRESENYFSFVQFSPGNDKIYEAYSCDSWEVTLTRFALWLHNLKRETEIEDKWERLQQEMRSIEIPFDNDNSKFNVSEFEILEKNINLLKTKISEIGLTESQNKIITNKLDYLIGQGKTMNKFDWKSLFIGSIITIIIQLSISHDQGIAIWGLIKKVFKNYLLP